MNNQNEERVETHAWEFTIPINVTVLAHRQIKYSEALQKLKDISKEDIFKAFLRSINNLDYSSRHPVWTGDEHLEEGVYLRELTYDEKYRGKQTPEIPIPVVWNGDKER